MNELGKKIEITTEKGTKLYYSLDYDLGGMNPFTYEIEPRGYYLSIQRNLHETAAFSSLSDECGAIRMLLVEVTRKSKKQETTAFSLIENNLKNLIAEFDL